MLWPRGSDWMPARTCSEIRAEVNRPRAATTSRKLGIPCNTGIREGMTWYQRTIWTSSGMMPDPDQRIFINSDVCEGCGDCSVQSNCISVLPLETEFGRKRKIDQSTCNKDYSCVKGFCPSFVTVLGGTLRKPARAGDAGDLFLALPQPALARYGLPEVRVADGQVRHNKAGASTIRAKIASGLAAGWLRLWQLTGTTHAVERVQPAVSRG